LRPCENSYKDQKGSIGNSLEVQKVEKIPENPHVLDWTQWWEGVHVWDSPVVIEKDQEHEDPRIKTE
jgi:Zn-dependent metalloprotease